MFVIYKLNSFRSNLTLLFILVLFNIQAQAQIVRATDSKGTIINIHNNNVTTAAIAPTSPPPLEGDVWFDTSNKIAKVYDGTSWLEIQASSALSIWDKDEDTGVQVEESADDDIIRFDANGREVLRLEEDKMVLTMKPLNTNGGGASSISFVPALDAANNVQLTLIETNGVGNSAENGFRYLVGNSLPTIDGVNGDGTVARHVNLGQPGSGSNVGIGYATSTPQSSIIHKLQVRGNARIGSLGEELQIGHVGHNNWAGIAHMNRATANNYALMQNAAGVTLLNASASQYISFRINNAQGAVLDAQREFGINVTDATQRLDVNGTGLFRAGGNSTNFTNNQLLFSYGGGANYKHAIRTRHNSGADTGNAIDFFTWDQGTDAAAGNPTLHGMTITQGRVGIGSVTAPTQSLDAQGTARLRSLGAGTVLSDANGNLSVSSDERLKSIQGNFDKGLAEILQLKPINYQWNSLSGLEQEGVYSGFSAQNVKAVIPEAVGEDSKGYLTLSDRPIIASLVNAMKELNTKNETLEKENKTLKATLDALLKRVEKLEEE